jgi:uncharacterized protein YgiM (DUF1202 family)
MIAYAPGRRRTARSVIKKWSLILLAVTATVTAVAASALFAYSARPEAKAVIIVAAVPTVTPVPYSPSGPDRSLPAAYPKPLVVPLGPRVASTASLHLGPGAEYAVLGTLQAGAHLEVVGRDESAEWLAIVFPPNSTLRAWLPASQALGMPEVEDLPIEPVRLLP